MYSLIISYSHSVKNAVLLYITVKFLWKGLISVLISSIYLLTMIRSDLAVRLNNVWTLLNFSSGRYGYVCLYFIEPDPGCLSRLSRLSANISILQKSDRKEQSEKSEGTDFEGQQSRVLQPIERIRILWNGILQKNEHFNLIKTLGIIWKIKVE